MAEEKAKEAVLTIKMTLKEILFQEVKKRGLVPESHLRMHVEKMCEKDPESENLSVCLPEISAGLTSLVRSGDIALELKVSPNKLPYVAFRSLR